MDEIYVSVIEALIFASDEPLSSNEIIKAIKEIDGVDTRITPNDIDNAFDELNKKYEGSILFNNYIKIQKKLT